MITILRDHSVLFLLQLLGVSSHLCIACKAYSLIYEQWQCSERGSQTQEREIIGQLCAGNTLALTALDVKFQRAWRQVQVSIPRYPAHLLSNLKMQVNSQNRRLISLNSSQKYLGAPEGRLRIWCVLHGDTGTASCVQAFASPQASHAPFARSPGLSVVHSPHCQHPAAPCIRKVGMTGPPGAHCSCWNQVSAKEDGQACWKSSMCIHTSTEALFTQNDIHLSLSTQTFKWHFQLLETVTTFFLPLLFTTKIIIT